MVVLALTNNFTMSEIRKESYIDGKNDEIWEHLPEWAKILKKIKF